MIKQWVIRKLGGVTIRDHQDAIEAQRKNHEEWAVKNLSGKNGEVTPDFSIYIPHYGDDIVIVRSKIEIASGSIKGLNVAPWCKSVIASGLIIID